eukprot:m.230586 g.230586  ORF g.230586 m.230586 type:complete len:144 (+) comp26457_c0_seq7:1261-1692(+)
MLPAERRGKTYYGMAHCADWYRTIVEGLGGGQVPNNTGPVPDDSFNLWPALMNNGTSPRTEVINQVANKYFNENCTSIRQGNFKLILGSPGDPRIVEFPKPGEKDVPFGQTGGVREPGTNHCMGAGEKQREGQTDRGQTNRQT